MEVISIQTRIMQPPQDDLFGVLNEFLPNLWAGDIVAISSKIVAIGEGRCEPIVGSDKQELVAREADLCIPRSYWSSPLTVTHSAFIGTAGIDASNANGHYVLLPKDPFASAKRIHEYVVARYDTENIGVIITDSHSTPLRRGATGVAIGWHGLAPTLDHVGESDLFGREMQIAVTNLVDGLAAAATVVMGETNQCKPIAIVRNAPNVAFTDRHTKDDAMVPFADDTFRVLYERFL